MQRDSKKDEGSWGFQSHHVLTPSMSLAYASPNVFLRNSSRVSNRVAIVALCSASEFLWFARSCACFAADSPRKSSEYFVRRFKTRGGGGGWVRWWVGVGERGVGGRMGGYGLLSFNLKMPEFHFRASQAIDFILKLSKN